MKLCASQPQNHSPCPRASARSVLTGRRRDRVFFTTEHTERPKAVTEYTESVGACRVPKFSVFSVPRSGFSVFCGKQWVREGINHRCHRYGLRPTQIYTDEWTAIRTNGRDGARPSRRRMVLRAESVRTPRAEGGAGTSRAGPRAGPFVPGKRLFEAEGDGCVGREGGLEATRADGWRERDELDGIGVLLVGRVGVWSRQDLG